MSLHEPTSQEEKTDCAPQRRLMRAKLAKAAIEGNTNDLTRLLGLQGEERSHDHQVEVELLIRNNAPDQSETTVENVEDVQSTTHFGNTVLHILATYGHCDLVSMCCRKDRALLRSRNDQLETPLHCAAKAGHHEVILKLIEHARNEGEVGLREFLRDRNCNEETALHEAARHGHATVVSVLMQEDPDLAGIVNNEKVSPLYMATARGSIDVVQIMVENLSDRVVGPEFYAGPNGQTALHAAVLQDAGPEIQEQQLSSFELKIRDLITKLEQNLILKVLRKDKDSTLSKNFTHSILQLRSVSPLPKEADDRKNTPLHFAALAGCNHLVELLLGHDLSLGYLRNKDELCPIHAAARKGHVKTIIVFLRRCIDSHELLDGSGKNFFHIAVEENRLEVFRKLLRKSTKKMGISGRDDDIFRNMINSGDSEGDTPLHLAVLKGNHSIIRAVLKYKGLDLGLQNKKGLTAVDLSVIEDQKKSPDTKGMQSLIEKYVKLWGIQFSPACFELDRDEETLRTELKEVKEPAIGVKDKIQVIGLGSVLIATVAFAAVFTVPGGNLDNGTPVFGRRSSFKAFILADILAFLTSFICIILLTFCCTKSLDQDTMEKEILSCLGMFSTSAKYLALALALGLYVVLSPISSPIIGIVFAWLSIVLLFDHRMYPSKNIYNTPLFVDFRPYVAKQRLVRSGRIFHQLRNIWNMYWPIASPLIVIFFVAFN